MSETTNLEAAKAAAAGASPVPDMRKRKAKAAPDSGETREPDLFVHLKPDCPVTALGIQGERVWLLDRFSQLQSFKPDEIRKGVISLIFGQDYALEEWPQVRQVEGTGKNGNPARFEPNGKVDQDGVQNALIAACAGKGIFKPQGKVFGRGAHRGRDDDSQLLLHMGNKVLISGAKDWRGSMAKIEVTVHRAGAIEGKYFPADDALQPPASEASSTDEAESLRNLFGQWFWVEPQASTLLLLGMVAQMFLPGALHWRSHLWLAGPTASGKSSLQKIIRAIHGDWVLTAEDASEAAIRQLLGNDTLPVMIDEAEGADNPERQRAMMNLAKKSSSGGKILRGGADHKGQEFTAQSCFLFSSVLHTPMLGEDRNRFCILDMKQIPATGVKPIDVGAMLPGWRAIGRKMHRRMLEQWPRFESTLATYKREIHSHGYMGRWQDTYGTLLACADMLLYDTAPLDDNIANDSYGREKQFVNTILPMMVRSMTEARPDDERCIAYLMSMQLQSDHGKPAQTVGQWLMNAMEPVTSDEGQEAIHHAVNTAARKKLQATGLRVVTLSPNKAKSDGFDKGEPLIRDWDKAYLAVAYSTCKPLLDLFARSEWAGGAWLQSLGKIEGVSKGLKIRFGGNNADNAIAIPLSALKGEE